jgi:thioesterase domain-containing protein
MLAILDAYPAREMLANLELAEWRGPAGIEYRTPGQVTEEEKEAIVEKLLEGVVARAGGRWSDIGEDKLPAFREVIGNNVLLRWSFVPGEFLGDLLLFVAEHDRPSVLPAAEAPRAWKPYVRGKIESHVIGSNHAGMAEPGPLSRIGQIIAAKLS